LARLTGSNVIRMGYCIYNNRLEQALALTTAFRNLTFALSEAGRASRAPIRWSAFFGDP
jgi:hypothetical protein